jgi:predicted TIM-barrel enzyme
MAWDSGSFSSNPEWRAMVTRVELLERRLRAMGVATTAYQNSNNQAAATAAKRFRIAVKNVGLSLVGTVTVDITWSSPLPSAVYNVDVACSALLGMPTVTVTNQTAAGCTISFVPGLLATNATLVALAVAPASTATS